MVQWVYENASRCSIITKVVVATDSEEIAAVIKACDGNVEMTSADLQTGSDRVATVAEKYPDMDIVINLQGDEPFIKPKMLEQLVAPYLAGDKPEMATLARKLDLETEYSDPRIVKAITALNGDALYFSRSPIPYFKSGDKASAPTYHHIGLYAFRRDFLMIYRNLSQTPLEKAESLEQLRALEHGYRIRVCLTEEKTVEVNDEKDLVAAQSFKFSLHSD
ncbi:MAG: 3-deoxy-manno-octulosonate cytidylyltransferase [uncultured bacterium]|nr:MAG: 3-deoxy-manno-octulosonate cytidylyltransferase [uncultured bacterium]